MKHEIKEIGHFIAAFIGAPFAGMKTYSVTENIYLYAAETMTMILAGNLTALQRGLAVFRGKFTPAIIYRRRYAGWRIFSYSIRPN